MFINSLLPISVIVSLTLSCRTASQSEAKDLQITDPKGKTTHIDEELLSAEIVTRFGVGRLFRVGQLIKSTKTADFKDLTLAR